MAATALLPARPSSATAGESEAPAAEDYDHQHHHDDHHAHHHHDDTDHDHHTLCRLWKLRRGDRVYADTTLFHPDPNGGC